MTSFMNIVQTPAYQRVEIGSTWYAQSVQRSGLNTRVKRLMLRYAFEQWPQRDSAPMLAVAVAGLVVNVVALFVLRGGDRANLNVRAAALHVVGDLLGSVAALAAAVIILTTGWTPIDPILSILLTLLILRGAWDVTRRAGHVRMEGAPAGFDGAAVKADLRAAVPGVLDVHHVHAWMLTTERPMVTLHVRLAPAADPAAALAAIKTRLKERFGIAHSTVQIESAECVD